MNFGGLLQPGGASVKKILLKNPRFTKIWDEENDLPRSDRSLHGICVRNIFF